MTTVVESLVVTLGLDAKDYKRGAEEAKDAQETMWFSAQDTAKKVEASQQRQARSFAQFGAFQRRESEADRQRRVVQQRQERAAELERRRAANEERRRREQQSRRNQQQAEEERRRTGDQIDRLRAIGLYAAAATLGFDSLKGAITTYANTANEVANASYLAPTIGTDLHKLQVLGNAYNEVGGKAEDAAGDIAKLAHAQFSIQTHAPDQMAAYLSSRLGLQYTELFDKTGKAKDPTQLMDLIRTRIQGITADLTQQAMLAREMGLSESFIRLQLEKQGDERAATLKAAEKAAKVNEKGADNTRQLQTQWQRFMNMITGTKQEIVSSTAGGLASVIASITNAGTNGPQGTSSNALEFHARGYEGAKPYEASFAAAEKKYGLPTGLLANVAHQESNFNPNAVSPAGAVGLMQLMPNVFPGAGKDVNKDIDTAAAELSRLYKHYKGLYGQQMALKLSLAAYNAGEGHLDHVIKGDKDKEGKPYALRPETLNYVPSVMSGVRQHDAFAAGAVVPAGSTASSGSTNVQIDSITVNTQAKDAQSVAKELPDALKRKGVVAQANKGMT